MKLTSFFNKKLPKWLASFLIIGVPLLFVWLFNGIWHGASFKYVLYGMYYYVLIMIGVLCNSIISKNKKKKNNLFFEIYEIVRTDILVCFGMLLFRSESFSLFVNRVLNMFFKNNNTIMSFGLDFSDFIILGIYIIILVVVGIYQEKHGFLYDKISKSHVLIQYAVWAILMLSTILFGLYGLDYNVTDFIYGDF